jgi:hypothetical protein
MSGGGIMSLLGESGDLEEAWEVLVISEDEDSDEEGESACRNACGEGTLYQYFRCLF